MMDTAGINIDRVYLLGLTQVDIQLYEPALDIARFRTVGRVIRWARTQVFTECQFEDDGQPGRGHRDRSRELVGHEPDTRGFR